MFEAVPIGALAEPAPGPEVPPGPPTPPDMELVTKTAAEYGLEILGPPENRLAARRWVDAFNARDDQGDADARTTDYIGHAPDSMHLPARDGDAWVTFLGTFVEGFPDLHLAVQDTVADEEMNAPRLLLRLMTAPLFRLIQKRRR